MAKLGGWNDDWDIESELTGALKQIRAERRAATLHPLLTSGRSRPWTDDEEKRFSQWQHEVAQLLNK
jgi:hypothetical protein